MGRTGSDRSFSRRYQLKYTSKGVRAQRKSEGTSGGTVERKHRLKRGELVFHRLW